MLPDLLEICQGVLLPLHDGGHSTKSGPLELLASVQRITELEQSNVIFGDLRDEMTGSIELTKRELVVVLVVQDIQQVAQEWVQVLNDQLNGLGFGMSICLHRGWGTLRRFGQSSRQRCPA